VVANGEAIQLLRKAGVPEDQLVPVAGGERVPLYTREIRQKAKASQVALAVGGPPGSPPVPDHSLAAVSVHIWPALHCLMPGTNHNDLPDVFDTGKSYTEQPSQYFCTLNITVGMKYGLMRLGDLISPEKMDPGMRSLADFLKDETNVLSAFDEGQLMYNFLVGDKVLLWNGHLGGYEGILRLLEPKPDVLVQAVAGRANLNGRPFNGSAAEFVTEVSRWLSEPERVIWCLCDDSPIKPFSVDTKPATAKLRKRRRLE